MARFFISLFAAAAFIALVTLFGVDQGMITRPTFLYKTLVILVLTTGIIFVYLYTARKPQFFLQLYLLTMVVKLLAYCAYNLVMVLSDRASAIENVVFFMVVYFVFTFLEIAFLYRKISAQ